MIIPRRTVALVISFFIGGIACKPESPRSLEEQLLIDKNMAQIEHLRPGDMLELKEGDRTDILLVERISTFPAWTIVHGKTPRASERAIFFSRDTTRAKNLISIGKPHSDEYAYLATRFVERMIPHTRALQK